MRTGAVSDSKNRAIFTNRLRGTQPLSLLHSRSHRHKLDLSTDPHARSRSSTLIKHMNSDLEIADLIGRGAAAKTPSESLSLSGAVDVELASRPTEIPAREDPALPEPGTPATHFQREEAAQHLLHVARTHVDPRDAMATMPLGTTVRVSVQSKERDHAALDVEEKEASEQSVTDIDTDSDTEADDALPPVAETTPVPDVDPSNLTRRDAARTVGLARVEARIAERVASLRGLPTTQPELKAPPSSRNPAKHLGPIKRPNATSN